MNRQTALKDATELQAEFEQLRDDMGALMKTVSRLADAGQRNGAAKLKDAGQAATERAREGLATAETAISDNPLKSVAIAFAVGMLIGKVVRRP